MKDKTPLYLKLVMLALNFILMPLPWFIKILVLPGMVFRGMEIFRRKMFFYSHWILIAIWYVLQAVSTLFAPNIILLIVYQFCFFFNYFKWRNFVKAKDEDWIEEWCKQSKVTFYGVHKTGIPYLGNLIGKVFPIWPFGRYGYSLDSKSNEIVPTTFGKTDEIRLIRGIDSSGEKGKTLGVGDIMIVLEKGKCGETEKILYKVPRPDWFRAYGRKYYTSATTATTKTSKESKSGKNTNPQNNINIDNINVNIYVDNK